MINSIIINKTICSLYKRKAQKDQNMVMTFPTKQLKNIKTINTSYNKPKRNK